MSLNAQHSMAFRAKGSCRHSLLCVLAARSLLGSFSDGMYPQWISPRTMSMESKSASVKAGTTSYSHPSQSRFMTEMGVLYGRSSGIPSAIIALIVLICTVSSMSSDLCSDLGVQARVLVVDVGRHIIFAIPLFLGPTPASTEEICGWGWMLLHRKFNSCINQDGAAGSMAMTAVPGYVKLTAIAVRPRFDPTSTNSLCGPRALSRPRSPPRFHSFPTLISLRVYLSPSSSHGLHRWTPWSSSFCVCS
mmetsp:Transcript_23246/g.54945  ORF Transcript_23246/g.54945 Transcript_23246/m.54945 type:complete len:248 (-) Transcript_23246:319-1062(-)